MLPSLDKFLQWKESTYVLVHLLKTGFTQNTPKLKIQVRTWRRGKGKNKDAKNTKELKSQHHEL
jgi:hypothetical protein